MPKRSGSGGRIGNFVVTTILGETVSAFVPPPLPPDPPLDLHRLINRLARANEALGRLDGIADVLPSSDLFVYMYVRKEAVLSSQIEGTQSSLADLLMLESDEQPSAPLDDVREVSNYVRAMTHGLNRIAGGFPLSLRLIREMHNELLKDGRGSSKQPGEFRTSQNWIGGSRPGTATFVPPPPNLIMSCLGDLETFLHDRTTYPVLIRAALAHVQFETIHPFLDGNGRLGRLLVTLMLCEENSLRDPILYLSLYLKANRARYYELLQQVRIAGDWEAWLEFFLDAVVEAAEQGVSTAKRLLMLFDEDRKKIAELKRAAASALRVHGEMQRSPIASTNVLARHLALSVPTVQTSIEHLMRLGILHEVTGRQRNRLYRYTSYLLILDEGTAPLPPNDAPAR